MLTLPIGHTRLQKGSLELNAEKLYCIFFTQKLTRLTLLKEIKPSPVRKMIKLLTFDNLFPQLQLAIKIP